MELSRGQAVVIDALFFLMICGACAATLIWAGSIYGDKSYEAYRYIYMTDYANSALTVLSNLEYSYSDATTGSQVQTSWLGQLGDYMAGDFDQASGRYASMTYQWEELCLQAPAPLLLVICSESRNVANGGCNKTAYEPIYLSCGEDEYSLLTLLEDEDSGEINVLKFPYYSSALESKRCGKYRCEMDIKIYY